MNRKRKKHHVNSKRALEDWPDILFTDDRDGRLFVSTDLRKPAVSGVGDALTGANEEGSEKHSEKVLALIPASPTLSAKKIARSWG